MGIKVSRAPRATDRSWVTAVWSYDGRTTDRIQRKAQRGLRSLGAVKLHTDYDGATVTETYKVQANGRTLGDMQRLLASYGIHRVYHGRNARVIHSGGAGENKPRRNHAADLYRDNRKLLESVHYRAVQQWRTEARAALESLPGITGNAARYLHGESGINTPKPNVYAAACIAELSRIRRLQSKLIAQWDSERIHECMESVVNAVLYRLSRLAQNTIERLSVA